MCQIFLRIWNMWCIDKNFGCIIHYCCTIFTILRYRNLHGTIWIVVAHEFRNFCGNHFARHGVPLDKRTITQLKPAFELDEFNFSVILEYLNFYSKMKHVPMIVSQKGYVL